MVNTPNYFLQTTKPISMNGKAANAYASSLSNNPFMAHLSQMEYWMMTEQIED
jgi:hypothetical protein